MVHICAYKRHMCQLLMMHHLQPLRGYAAERRDMHQEYSSVALVVTLPVLTQCSGPCSVTGVANASSSPKPCLCPFNSFLSSPVDSVVCGHVLFSIWHQLNSISTLGLSPRFAYTLRSLGLVSTSLNSSERIH